MDRAQRRRRLKEANKEGWIPAPTNKYTAFRRLDKALQLLKAWGVPYTQDDEDDDNFISKFTFTIPDHISKNPDKLKRFEAGEFPREEDKCQVAE